MKVSTQGMGSLKTIEQVILPRLTPIGLFTVRRVLPFRSRRMVGPFCFLDHMGPHLINQDKSADVLSHPHIGLSTLTYLFEGKFDHRDSLGSFQTIIPGDVNWMTAGAGIVHSERVNLDNIKQSASLHGLQAWVALPEEYQECSPFFEHYKEAQIPYLNKDGVLSTLIAGEALNLKSPVRVSSPLFYLKLELKKNSVFETRFDNWESAFYLINGSVQIDNEIFKEPTLITFKNGAHISIKAIDQSLGVLLGGEPMPEGRLMYWNFVSTKKELIEKAKHDWQNGNFKMIAGENGFVTLPN